MPSSTSEILRRMAIMVALVCFVALSSAGNSAAPSRVVNDFKVYVDTESTYLGGEQAILVRTITIRGRSVSRTRPLVRCDQKSCVRLSDRGRYRKKVKRNEIQFKNVNWVLARRNTVTVAIHQRGRVGRYRRMGVAQYGSTALSVRKAGCLLRNFRKRKCPRRTKIVAPGTPVPAPTASGNVRRSSVLESGAIMRVGDGLESPSRSFRLVMQSDDNLVQYQGSKAVWSTQTFGSGYRAVMQPDGNFVVYDGGTAKWNSNTQGFGGARLNLQDDGNLVVYRSTRALWSRLGGYVGDVLQAGQRLRTYEYLWSSNHQFRLFMQGDGNLVLYGTKALWSSMTVGLNYYAETQGDGNFVVYSGSGQAKWNSSTFGAGARLVVQNDSNLVVYHGGKAVWSR